MKVLFLLETNTLSRTAVEVMRAYVDQGSDPLFVTMRPRSDLHREVETLGIPTRALDVGSSGTYPASCRRLSRMIAEHGTDVVHGVEPVPATLGVGGALLAHRPRPLRVFHRQHSVARWPQSLFSRVASRGSELVIACSSAAGEMALQDGVPSSKLRVVPNGVPAPRRVGSDELAELRAQLSIPPDAFVVATVARLRPEKGIDIAMRALSEVATTAPEAVHFVVAGDGPQAEYLRQESKRAQVPVHLVGHQSDVAPWNQIADVIVMASLYDAAPLSAAEAMACGKPIVASATGGLLEMVQDNVTGALVPPGEPAPLAEAIGRLLGNPELRQRLGAAARKRYEERYTVDRMVGGCVACYQELLVARA